MEFRGKQVLVAPLPYTVRQLILSQRSRQKGLQICHPQEVWLLCSPGIEVTADQGVSTFALVLQNIILHTIIRSGGSRSDLIEIGFLRHVTHTKVYSADTGIITNTTSDFSSTCVVLALVAGRQDFSLDLAASDSDDDCFSQQLSTTASLHDCNDNLRDAFQCISVHRAA